MATTKKLKEFFEGRRRKITLTDWRPLKTKGSETRMKLHLSMPLLCEPLQGIPTPIGEAFGAMSADESTVGSMKLNIMYDGMTAEFFSTDSSKLPWECAKGHASITGAMFDKFAIVAAGEGEKRTVNLEWVAYIPATEGMKEWAWPHLHSVSYVEAVYSQSEMSSEFSPEEEDEEGEQDPEAESTAPAPAAAASSTW